MQPTHESRRVEIGRQLRQGLAERCSVEKAVEGTIKALLPLPLVPPKSWCGQNNDRLSQINKQLTPASAKRFPLPML